MGMLSYVVTKHKSTSVTHSCVGNFTSLECRNLVVAKCNRIEIHNITSQGIELIRDVPINGRIVSLQPFHLPNGALDVLFILTERYKACVLQWDASSSELITRYASTDIDSLSSKTPLVDQICAVDPDCRVIGLYLNTRWFQVFEFVLRAFQLDNTGKLEKPFGSRICNLLVKDVTFLYGCDVPTVAVICQDGEGARHAKTYDVSHTGWVPVTGPWARDNIDKSASLLIALPIPLCGVLIIGAELIVYCSANTYTETPKTCFTTKESARVDEFKYLLGDDGGGLHLLAVSHENQRVTDLTVELLGETSIASTISYLGNSLVFVGSSCGDSQLIKIVLDAQGSRIQVLRKFVNLGPIHDLCLVDPEKHGQSQVVTCSGGSKYGSLRIVSKGINEQASLELEGITGLWSLKSSVDGALDTFLVVSFISETRIFAMNRHDELEETEIKGFLSQVRTLFCHHAVHNQLVQVTSSSVRLVSSETSELLSKWDAPDGLNLNIATANARQVLLASKDNLFYLEVGDGELKEMRRTQLDSPASCLDINPIGDDPCWSELALVGNWTYSMEIRKLPDLTLVNKKKIGENVNARSVLLCAFQGISYVLCALGDGNLIIFQLDKITREIVVTKKVSLGTQPITLHTFSWENAEYVFAASHRPATIYSSDKKLFINEIDLGDVIHMCQLNLAAYPDSIAIATKDKLTIGNIDPTQKHHIRTIPLGEFARCICHQTQTSTYGVCTTQNSETHFVRLLEAETFNVLSAYQLRALESGEYIVSCLFTGDDKEYYCVGTKSVLPGEEPYITKGRLLVFSVEHGQLQLIFEKETPRGVTSVKAFNGKLLSGWGHELELYKWTQRELQLECRNRTFSYTQHVQTQGNIIFTADDLAEIRLFVYKPAELELEKQAEFSYHDGEASAVEILDDSVYLTGTSYFNLCTLMKKVEDTEHLELVGQYHLGDMVTRFCLLVDYSKIIFGTHGGMIGVISSLTTDQYGLLKNIQSSMRSRIAPLGGLVHSDWRSFYFLHVCKSIPKRSLEDKNFIDGDLIESFLDLSMETKESIANDVGISLKELCETVEELKRLH